MGEPDKILALTDDEAKAWGRLADALVGARLLTTVDGPALAMFAEALAEWRLARAKIDETGGGVLYTTANRYPIKNPWLAIRDAAAARVLKLCDAFGMTPAARTKLTLPMDSKSGDDEMEAMLDG